jgi:hypothetical protein
VGLGAIDYRFWNLRPILMAAVVPAGNVAMGETMELIFGGPVDDALMFQAVIEKLVELIENVLGEAGDFTSASVVHGCRPVVSFDVCPEHSIATQSVKQKYAASRGAEGMEGVRAEAQGLDRGGECQMEEAVAGFPRVTRCRLPEARGAKRLSFKKAGEDS